VEGAGGGAYGIITSGNHGGRIAGNRVRDVVSTNGIAHGISNGLSGRVVVRDNQVT
jgi:hypothetical protein